MERHSIFIPAVCVQFRNGADTDAFRDEAARREYLISRLCEQCSDALALPVTRDDAPGRGHPVLHGLVAAVICDAFPPSECAIIPFRADPHLGGVEWVSEHVVRAGRALPHLEPFAELAALCERWAEGQVRVIGGGDDSRRRVGV